MKLSNYVVRLFLDSDEGSQLVLGFECLRGMYAEESAEDETEDEEHAGSADPSEANDDGELADSGEDDDSSDGEEPDEDDENLHLRAMLAARSTLPSCFNEAVPCVLRTLAARGVARPTSAVEARGIYEALMTAGIVVTVEDEEALDAAEEWIEPLAAELQAEADEEEGADTAGEADSGESGDADDSGEEAEDEEDSEDEEEAETSTPPDWSLEIGGPGDEDLANWLRQIGPLTWALHDFAPEFFLPYAFLNKFDLFEAICNEFEIPLPQLPGKADRAARARYYLDINEALNEFRQANEMSPAEFCAFLYGFCVDHVPADELDELPAPRRAWFLMAHPTADADDLDAADEDTRTHWQGSYDMRPGDVCVMWCRAPRSYVHSIWRATSRGFAEPFFYYYRQVWISRAIHVPHVTFRELQQDATWSQKPAVRAHFQNSSGREVTHAEYEALLRIFEAKGFDTSVLPQFERDAVISAEGLERERDVEEKLLEPLLHRLGYRPNDWQRQFPVRMGRGERCYPDYVFQLRGKRGEEEARMIAEAKYRITSDAALREAYLQARSYAERLRARDVVLCALEGVWVFWRDRDAFSFERREHYRWSELEESATLGRVAARIGMDR